jgi:hypothetical protein
MHEPLPVAERSPEPEVVPLTEEEQPAGSAQALAMGTAAAPTPAVASKMIIERFIAISPLIREVLHLRML